MKLVTDIYKETQKFPLSKIYGLTSQIRRVTISIPSNISEGFGRKSTLEYLKFLEIALSSLFEIQTQIEISLNLQYFNKDKLFESTKEIKRMLFSLITKLKG